MEDLFGEPNPIVVLKFNNIGFFDLRVLSRFFFILVKSCPSPLETSQLTDSNLKLVLSEKDKSVEPSILILLLS